MGKFEIVWSTEDFTLDAQERGYDAMVNEMLEETLTRIYEENYNGKEEFYHSVDKHDNLYPMQQYWYSFTDGKGNEFGKAYIAIVQDGDKWFASVVVSCE